MVGEYGPRSELLLNVNNDIRHISADPMRKSNVGRVATHYASADLVTLKNGLGIRTWFFIYTVQQRETFWTNQIKAQCLGFL